VPEAIHPGVAPETGREYLLYRPSAYRREQSWPLIVVCHPSSPNRTIRQWTGLAETHGFLVAAPELRRADKPLRGDDIEPGGSRLEETQVLSVVEHIRAGHNISEDRIFIHGAEGGSLAALRAGVKYSDVFRALSVVEPSFERAAMSDLGNFIDPHQPVYLSYRTNNLLTGKKGRECADWLRAYGADLRLDHFSMGNDPQRITSFFQNVLRTTEWIQVRAAPSNGANPLEVRFSLRINAAPAQYRWQFGDGEESPVAEPVHAYAKPGKYRVIVTVSGPKLGQHTRHVDVSVPTATVQQARNRF